MKIIINALWRDSGYGYIVGKISVTDHNDNLLMQDEDMYWSLENFVHISTVNSV